jgi:hypothetical protein
VFLHYLFGLHLESNLHIPLIPLENPESSTIADICVTFQESPEWAARALKSPSELVYASPERDNGRPDILLWKLDGGNYFRLAFVNGTEFCVDQSGRRVFAYHLGTFDLADVAIPLRGVVMGFVLQLRGVACLHASAFELHGNAIVLCGPSTSGKSTTAAALAKRGYPVLTEDVLPILERDAGFVAQPSFPLLTLWPDAAQLLFGASHGLPRLCADYAKFYLPLDAPGWNFQPKPLPMGAVYILDESMPAGRPFVTELLPQERLVRLAANIYHVRLLPQDVYARELLQLGRIANAVPVKKLNLGSSTPNLAQLCDCILADAEKIEAGGRGGKNAGAVASRLESPGL